MPNDLQLSDQDEVLLESLVLAASDNVTRAPGSDRSQFAPTRRRVFVETDGNENVYLGTGNAWVDVSENTGLLSSLFGGGDGNFDSVDTGSATVTNQVDAGSVNTGVADIDGSPRHVYPPIVDDMEGNVLDRWEPQSGGNLSVGSGYRGERSLVVDGGGLDAARLGLDGGIGTAYSAYVKDRVDDRIGVFFAADADNTDAYLLRIDLRSDDLEILRVDGGSYTQLASTATSVTTDTWYLARYGYSFDNELTLSFFEADGTVKDSVSATDDTYETGEFSFGGAGGREFEIDYLQQYGVEP